MLKRNLWKILLSLALLGWAIAELVPLKDRPFPDYARSRVTTKQAEFGKLIDEATTLAKSHQYPSEFVALKQLATQRHIDLAAQYFPSIDLGDVKNVDRRNALLLDYLDKSRKSRLQLGLDLKGGVAVTLEMVEKPGQDNSDYVRKKKIEQAVDILARRINAFGVSEPLIRPIGTNRIEVQVPGLDTKSNPEVLDAIKKPARLDFRLVEADSRGAATPQTDVPAGYEVLGEENENRQTGDVYTLYYVVKRIPEMTGEHIERAVPIQDQFGGFQVHLNFDKTGAKQFGDVTSASVGRLLAIVLDGKLVSAPRINDAITGGSAQITGRFTQRDAEQLASALNNPLDTELIVKAQNEVGPSLAQDAISSGWRAAIIGTALVAAFMVTFYTTGGIVAVLMLAINLVIILGVMANLGATMTLPGLAGIVLTIGMAVDANILIFERMREELAEGKSLAASNQGGFIKALTTILDAHLVQLIICAIMILLGTGPIRGFGVTLCIGVLSTLFSVLITGHMVMEMFIESGWLKKLVMFRLLKDLQVDFVKYGKPAAIGSIALVVVSIGYVFYQGNRIYGVDFSGGEVISLQFKEKLDTAKIRDTAKTAGVSDINPTYVNPIGGGRETLNIETPEGKSTVVLGALQQKFPSAGFEKIGEEHIGASIGREIELNALKAVGISMLVILLYIAFRFEFGFGVGAMASTLHDVLMNIGIFVLFGHQFSAPMVAAILCVVGYSINETVVVFDRIREELKLSPTGHLRDIINSAIRKVFARTIMTATTTFLAALALFLFGGGVLKDISFCFLVGIVTSTFSAIFIAAQVFYWWHKGDRKHVEAHRDVAPKYEWQGASRASE